MSIYIQMEIFTGPGGNYPPPYAPRLDGPVIFTHRTIAHISMVDRSLQQLTKHVFIQPFQFRAQEFCFMTVRKRICYG